MADNLFEAKVDLELPVQVFADAYGNISRGLKRIYTKENGDVVFVLTDGTEHIVGNVVGQQGPTGPASTVPGPTGPTGATGKQGEPGNDGENGKDGENGAPGIYYGSTQPSGPDFPVWIDPSGAAGIPLSITGPTGATGAPGAKGDKGEPGAKGDKGDKGDTGATPNLSIGTVTTLEAGQNATASMGGTAESPVLNLGIPKGAKGEPGEGGGGAGAWYVTLTPDDDGNITADKTMAEIEAAYQAGYAVYCIFLYIVGFFDVPIIAPLTIHNANAQYTFCGVGTMDKLYSFQFSLIKENEESRWTVLQKEIPQGKIPTVVTSVSASSTDSEVPSAKCLYDLVGNVTALIDAM